MNILSSHFTNSVGLTHLWMAKSFNRGSTYYPMLEHQVTLGAPPLWIPTPSWQKLLPWTLFFLHRALHSWNIAWTAAVSTIMVIIVILSRCCGPECLQTKTAHKFAELSIHFLVPTHVLPEVVRHISDTRIVPPHLIVAALFVRTGVSIRVSMQNLLHVSAAVLKQLVWVIVEDHEGDIASAKDGQLHGLFHQPILSLHESDLTSRESWKYEKDAQSALNCSMDLREYRSPRCR